MTLTPEEVDAASRKRARQGSRRSQAIAGFVVLCMVVFSIILTRSQNQLEEYVNDQCAQRAVNAKKTNQNWDDLAEIERTNPFIDDRVRKARLRVFENAKLKVPDCKDLD